MTRSLQAVACRRPSVLESVAGGQRLGLETSEESTPSGAVDHPGSLTGFLTSPRRTSAAAVDDGRGATAVLPRLAEADGEAGEAVHLCVAYGPGARHAEDRPAAVDALPVPAACERLDTVRLGSDLGQLVRGGAVKPVRTSAATEANAAIWGVLRQVLPALLADPATGSTGPSARGLGELLAVAAECAERVGARGDLPHLPEAADRRGSSRLVRQARRLRSAPAEEAAAA